MGRNVVKKEVGIVLDPPYIGAAYLTHLKTECSSVNDYRGAGWRT
jgi:hypothetical protein